MNLKSLIFTALLISGLVLWIFVGSGFAEIIYEIDVEPANLWLGFSKQQAMMGPPGLGYVGKSLDPWLDESWVSGAMEFDLWMYNYRGKPPVPTIGYDVRLLAAIPTRIKNGFSIQVVDPILPPGDPNQPALVEVMDITDGWKAPLDWPGVNYSPHGVYVPGTTYYEFQLHYNLYPKKAHSWHITVNKMPVHFDAFGLDDPATKQKLWISTPFSHDATVVPEPGTLLLLSTGVLGFLPFIKRRRKK